MPGSSGAERRRPAGHFGGGAHEDWPGASGWWLGSPMHILQVLSSRNVPRSPPAVQSAGRVVAGEAMEGICVSDRSYHDRLMQARIVERLDVLCVSNSAGARHRQPYPRGRP